MTTTSKKIIYYLTFPYLLFSIFEFYINTTIGYIPRYFFLVYTGFLVISFILSELKKGITKNQLLFILWTIYSIVTVIWSSNVQQFNVYFYTFFTMCIVIVCIWNIKFSSDQIDKLLTFYQICSFLLCILGVFFSRPLLDDATNRIRYVLYIRGNRADPNYLLALYVISLQIGYYRVLNKSNNTIFNILSIVTSFYVILYTGSRSGVVIIAASFIIISWNRLNSNSLFQNIRLLLIIFIMGIAVYYIASNIIPQAVINRVLGLSDLNFFNGTGRLESWARKFEKWNTWYYQLFGMGFGSNTAHSTLLTFVLEFGIFGTILYTIPMISIIKKSIKLNNSLALALFTGGMIQAFLCPATNMRFFWNSMIIPIIIMNVQDKDYSKKV